MRSFQSLSYRPLASRRFRAGFSLVEVTLAIGILAFCMIPLLGLLPTGLNAQRRAVDAAAAVDALTMLTTAINSSQIDTRTAGVITYRLPRYFTDSGAVTMYKVGDPPLIRTYGILEDGSIRQANDTTKTARQTLYVKIIPPATDAQILAASTSSGVTPATSVRVQAIVAWPALSSDDANMAVDKLKNRTGYLETYLTYVPPTN